MQTLPDVVIFLANTLGQDPVELFNRHMEDFLYCVRSWALTDLNSPRPKVTERLTSISQGILAESIKLYLHQKFNIDGRLAVKIIKETVCDDQKKEIEEIRRLKEAQAAIVDCMVANMMEEFEAGRIIAANIVKRAREYNSHIKPQDFDSDRIPMESIEIELMRLEKKLPNLTEDEGDRLSSLYEVISQCVGN